MLRKHQTGWAAPSLAGNAFLHSLPQVHSSSSLRAIVDYEDVVVAICVQNPGRVQQPDDALSGMADSQFEHSQWNFTSADAAALDMMGVWPLHESNPFLQDLLQTREASTHLTDDVHTFGLSHDAAFYHSVVTSILDRFRFVFVLAPAAGQ